MARIVSATIPLVSGPVPRDLRIGSVIRYMRMDGAEVRVFVEVPNPTAPLERRNFHLIQQNVDVQVNPNDYHFVGAVTTPLGADWFLYERTV